MLQGILFTLKGQTPITCFRRQLGTPLCKRHCYTVLYNVCILLLSTRYTYVIRCSITLRIVILFFLSSFYAAQWQLQIAVRWWWSCAVAPRWLMQHYTEGPLHSTVEIIFATKPVSCMGPLFLFRLHFLLHRQLHVQIAVHKWSVMSCGNFYIP